MMARDTPGPDPADWRRQAACRGQDPDLFHPTPITQYAGHRTRPKLEAKAIAWAKAICASCPVGGDCEQDAAGDTMSIRNGKLPEERNPNPTSIDGRITCGTDAGYRAHYRRGDRGDDVCGPCREAHSEARFAWVANRGRTA